MSAFQNSEQSGSQSEKYQSENVWQFGGGKDNTTLGDVMRELRGLRQADLVERGEILKQLQTVNKHLADIATASGSTAYNTQLASKELRAIEKECYFMEQRSDAVSLSQCDITRLLVCQAQTDCQ